MNVGSFDFVYKSTPLNNVGSDYNSMIMITITDKINDYSGLISPRMITHKFVTFPYAHAAVQILQLNKQCLSYHNTLPAKKGCFELRSNTTENRLLCALYLVKQMGVTAIVILVINYCDYDYDYRITYN